MDNPVEQGTCEATKSPFGTELLQLYMHCVDLGEKNLEVGRDIVLKNYVAFGAIMTIPSAGLFTENVNRNLMWFGCGFVIAVISLACRAMAIFYDNYVIYLNRWSWIYYRAALRGKDGLYVERKRKEERTELGEFFRKSNSFTLTEFLTAGGVLVSMNTFPALIGIGMMLYGIFHV